MTYVWHYAPWERLARIVGARELAACEGEGPGEGAMVWFSARQDWEPTATSSIRDVAGRVRRLGFEEQRALLGCIRFGLPGDDARLLAWAAACKVAGTSFTDRRKLESAGRLLGANPADWFAVPEPLSIVGLRFQVLLERWGDVDMSEAVRAWERVRGAAADGGRA